MVIVYKIDNHEKFKRLEGLIGSLYSIMSLAKIPLTPNTINYNTVFLALESDFLKIFLT